MQISSRFTIAVHILICVDLFGKHEPATSESLAGSIGVHPVVIRRILGQLRRADARAAHISPRNSQTSRSPTSSVP